MKKTTAKRRRIPSLMFLGLLPCVALMGTPRPAAAQTILQFTFRVYERPDNYPFYDHDGNPGTNPVRVEAAQEISSIMVGKDFVVKVFVQDTRPSGATGVFAAYLDVNFENAQRASLVPSLPFVVHPQTGNPTPYLHNAYSPPNVFGNGAYPATGDALIDTDGDQTPDQINGLGSFSGIFSGTGSGELLLVEFAMTAEEAGDFVISGEPTTESPQDDPGDAGQSPLLDCFLFGSVYAICPSQAVEGCQGAMAFQSAALTILPPPPPAVIVVY